MRALVVIRLLPKIILFLPCGETSKKPNKFCWSSRRGFGPPSCLRARDHEERGVPIQTKAMRWECFWMKLSTDCRILGLQRSHQELYLMSYAKERKPTEEHAEESRAQPLKSSITISFLRASFKATGQNTLGPRLGSWRPLSSICLAVSLAKGGTLG